MKKIKNSVKTEMKNMVQKELAKIMARQISNEDFFKEMVQDTIADFYEDEAESKDFSTSSPFSNHKTYSKLGADKSDLLNDIFTGKYKDEFKKILDVDVDRTREANTTSTIFNPMRFSPVEPSKVRLSESQLNSMFARDLDINKPETVRAINSTFSKPNPYNMSILSSINGKQAIQDYNNIHYTKDTMAKIFECIEKFKGNLTATHEQIHHDTKSIETYKVSYIGGGFSFEIEIQTRLSSKTKTINLKNVNLLGDKISEGITDLKSIEKLLDLAQEIYSETPILPISKTVPDTSKEESSSTPTAVMFNKNNIKRGAAAKINKAKKAK